MYLKLKEQSISNADLKPIYLELRITYAKLYLYAILERYSDTNGTSKTERLMD